MMQALNDNERGDLVTALMEFQCAEDDIARALQKIVSIAPNMGPQMVKHIGERLGAVGGSQRESFIHRINTLFWNYPII